MFLMVAGILLYTKIFDEIYIKAQRYKKNAREQAMEENTQLQVYLEDVLRSGFKCIASSDVNSFPKHPALQKMAENRIKKLRKKVDEII